MQVNMQGCTCPTAWWGIYPPPPCPFCSYWRGRTYSTGTFTFVTDRTLSDEEVKRIAKELAKQLKDGC